MDVKFGGREREREWVSEWVSEWVTNQDSLTHDVSFHCDFGFVVFNQQQWWCSRPYKGGLARHQYFYHPGPTACEERQQLSPWICADSNWQLPCHSDPLCSASTRHTEAGTESRAFWFWAPQRCLADSLHPTAGFHSIYKYGLGIENGWTIAGSFSSHVLSSSWSCPRNAQDFCGAARAQCQQGAGWGQGWEPCGELTTKMAFFFGCLEDSPILSWNRFGMSQKSTGVAERLKSQNLLFTMLFTFCSDPFNVLGSKICISVVEVDWNLHRDSEKSELSISLLVARINRGVHGTSMMWTSSQYIPIMVAGKSYSSRIQPPLHWLSWSNLDCFAIIITGQNHTLRHIALLCITSHHITLHHIALHCITLIQIYVYISISIVSVYMRTICRSYLSLSLSPKIWVFCEGSRQGGAS